MFHQYVPNAASKTYPDFSKLSPREIRVCVGLKINHEIASLHKPRPEPNTNPDIYEFSPKEISEMLNSVLLKRKEPPKKRKRLTINKPGVIIKN